MKEALRIEFGRGKLTYRPVSFSDGSKGISIRAKEHNGPSAVELVTDEEEWSTLEPLALITFASKAGVDLFIGALQEAKELK